MKGEYIICDGGYHRWPCLITSDSFDPNLEARAWGAHLESVRKRIECIFGILKKRFRLLKLPINLQYKDDVQNAFITCCVFHNMLLRYDGLDEKWNQWNLDVEGMFVDDDKLEVERVEQAVGQVNEHDEVHLTNLHRRAYLNSKKNLQDLDYSRRGLPPVNPNNYSDDEEDYVDTWLSKRERLIAHFSYQKEKGNIVWVK